MPTASEPLNPQRATFDAQFHAAVDAIDAGNVALLERLIDATPALVRDRLDAPGRWLRDTVDGALDGFFERPFLLWFVAEDPMRTGRLPANIADVARTIVDAARRAGATLQPQLDYALSLVAWSGVAAQCGVQLDLIDVLVDAGASTAGAPMNALVNGHVAAAEHLVKRGAPLDLATALCLGRWDDADRLVATAAPAQKQLAIVLAALRGNANALRRILAAGVDPNSPSADLYSHATPLHHAVSSGSLDAVRVLVEAGASLTSRDSAWDATPLGWAEHSESEGGDQIKRRQYSEIAAYLRAAASRSR